MIPPGKGLTGDSPFTIISERRVTFLRGYRYESIKENYQSLIIAVSCTGPWISRSGYLNEPIYRQPWRRLQYSEYDSSGYGQDLL